MKTPDSETIKEFFINHTEKIIFGIFVLLFLLIVWGGFNLKPMTITLQELQNSVQQGQQKLETSKPDTSSLKSQNFAEEAQKTSKVIPKETLALLDMKQTFRHPIAQPQVKRLQPPILSLIGLQATSGVGVCPEISSNSSASQTAKDKGKVKAKRGVHWVMVTALIPFEEQEKKFTATFKKADVQYPESDKPVYYSYYAEREEITENGSQGWKPVVLKDAFSLNEQYYKGSGAQENVKSEYIIPAENANNTTSVGTSSTVTLSPYPMVMHLMNISKHQWGADGAHLPEIPADVSVDMASHDNVNEEDEEISDDRSGEAPIGSIDEHGNVAPAKLPPYRLFRFIDTNIESGKKYRYRFKLVLKNPNFAVKPEYVAEESMTKNPIIEGDWSEPSPIAEVPLDIRLFCVGAREKESSSNKTSLDQELGPIGSLLILKFDAEQGIEISKILSNTIVKTGNVLNAFKITHYETDSNVSKKAIDFKTDNFVLGTTGIEKPRLFITLPTPPVRTLIMDNNGRIMELSEIADKPTVFMKVKKSDETNISPTPSDHDIFDDPHGGRPGVGKTSTQKNPKRTTKPKPASQHPNGSTGSIFD